MTPEERRWTKIENALATTTAMQAQHAEEIRELTRLHKSLVVAQLKTTEQIQELGRKIDRFLKGNRPNGGPSEKR